MSQEERHYNIEKLNKIFAISAVVLLVAVVMMFAKDYLRGWKKHQAEFRALEVEKARIKYDEASNTLEGNAEYIELLKEFEQIEKAYEADCFSFHDIEKELVKLKAHDDVVQQKFKFTKAELDAAKYIYESAEAHHGTNLKAKKKTFEDLKASVAAQNLEVEQSQAQLAAKQNIIDSCGDALKSVQKKRTKLELKKSLLERKLANIDPAEMNLTNQFAQFVRDMPVVDLANPNNKIGQIVLKDIKDDVNFLNVPKVDRCVTCHLGITNPDYIEAVQPYRTHPNLDQYVGVNSPHPIEEFGCTSCHGGRGRGTSFLGAEHTPNSEQQKKEWIEKYHWKKNELWEDPMSPLRYAESGCFKCHDSQGTIRGAEKLNLGLHIIEKSGCYNCHAIDKYENWPKVGPDLTRITSKFSKQWGYNWIRDPQSFRHAWMPSYYNQSNNSSKEDQARAEQEIHAMIHFLFNKSKNYPLDPIPVAGDPKTGKELVSSVGCLACHQVNGQDLGKETTRDTLRRQHGPNLSGLGSKTSKEWLYNWLKNPADYHHETRMPNLRLTDQEAADIAVYLSLDKNIEFDRKDIPEVNEQILSGIVREFLIKSNTNSQTDQKMAKMNLNDKLDMAGKNLVSRYGCYSCHNIQGFEGRKPIGVELTEEGSKSIHKLDFGFQHIEHTNYAWFEQKLKDPRIFDEGKIKAADEKLLMPNYNLTDEETEAVVTALMGFVNDKTVESKKRPLTSHNETIDAGQEVVKQFNCQGCHIIEGEGGAIQGPVKEWLVKYDGRDKKEADAIVTSFSPPNLIGEGQKVKTQWLFDFLHTPTVVRPWLKARMPTYGFDAAQLNILTKYFSALDLEEYPFTDEVDVSMTKAEFDDAKKLFSNEYFGCAKCHIVGDQLPGGSPDSWAPNFALSKDRLKPEWIINWLMNPADLLPGTKMPTYFDPQNFDVSGPEDLFEGDEVKQIEMLRNYLITVGHTPEAAQKIKAKIKEALPSTEPPAAQ